MAFLSIDVVGTLYARGVIGRLAAEVPVLTANLPGRMKGDVADIAVRNTRSVSPVDTGQLADRTGWRDAGNGMGEVKIEILSDAVNTSNRPYARFRAFGFHTRGGNEWIPPEVPTYPEQAAKQTMVEIKLSGLVSPAHFGVFRING